MCKFIAHLRLELVSEMPHFWEYVPRNSLDVVVGDAHFHVIRLSSAEDPVFLCLSLPDKILGLIVLKCEQLKTSSSKIKSML